MYGVIVLLVVRFVVAGLAWLVVVVVVALVWCR